MMFELLIKDFLDDLDDDLQKELLADLEHAGKEFAVDHVTKLLARVILKGIDGIVAATVKVAGQGHALTLAHGYADVVDEQMLQLQDVIKTYIPLQVAVEMAKKEHGKNSAEANEARKARAEGIAAVRQEVDDVLFALVGEHVVD